MKIITQKEHEIVDDKIEKNKTFQAQDNHENKAKKMKLYGCKIM